MTAADTTTPSTPTTPSSSGRTDAGVLRPGRSPSPAESADRTEPAEPSHARRRRLPRLRRLPWRRLRMPTSPTLLRVGMGLAILPVALFAAAVQLGIARNETTVRTVGREATEGITAAQAIKLNLAELDEIVVRKLLDPVSTGEGGFPPEYDVKRRQLHDNLVLAASDAPASPAFRQPLVHIEYALAHYHNLVRDAFAAQSRGDTPQAAVLYSRAHEDVMDGTLLPEADFLDKANTYVLENSYDRQRERSASTVRLIGVSWAVLIGFLVLLQLLLARRFRRLLNPALLAATVLAVSAGGFALFRLDESASELTTAREQAFDSLHVLARAQATVVAARQSEGALLLSPDNAPVSQEDFDTNAGQLLRAQDGSTVVLGRLARSGVVPEGGGGYLATVAGHDGQGTRQQLVRRTIVTFGEFVTADDDLRDLTAAGGREAALPLYQGAEAYTALTGAIDTAHAATQATFDQHVDAAMEASANVEVVATAAAGAVLLLVVAGLYLRLREYGA